MKYTQYHRGCSQASIRLSGFPLGRDIIEVPGVLKVACYVGLNFTQPLSVTFQLCPLYWSMKWWSNWIPVDLALRLRLQWTILRHLFSFSSCAIGYYMPRGISLFYVSLEGCRGVSTRRTRRELSLLTMEQLAYRLPSLSRLGHGLLPHY